MSEDRLNRSDNDNLICPICRTTFIHPKSLPFCQHSFCESCIRKYAYMNGHSQKGELPCPTCGHLTLIPDEGVSGFDDNKQLMNLLENNPSTKYEAPQPEVKEQQIPQSNGGNKDRVEKSEADGRNKDLIETSQSDGRNKDLIETSQSDGRNKDLIETSQSDGRNKGLVEKNFVEKSQSDGRNNDLIETSQSDGRNKDLIETSQSDGRNKDLIEPSQSDGRNKGLVEKLQSDDRNKDLVEQNFVEKSQSDGRNKDLIETSQSDGRNKDLIETSQSDGRNKDLVENSQSDGRNKDLVEKDVVEKSQSDGRNKDLIKTSQSDGRNKDLIETSQYDGRNKDLIETSQSDGMNKDLVEKNFVEKSQSDGRNKDLIETSQSDGRNKDLIETSQSDGRNKDLIETSQSDGRNKDLVEKSQYDGRNKNLVEKPQSHCRNKDIVEKSQSGGRNKALMQKTQSHSRNKGFVEKSQSDCKNKGLVEKTQSHSMNKGFLENLSRCSTTVTEMMINKAEVDILSATEWAILKQTEIKSGAALHLKNISEAGTMPGDNGSQILVVKGTLDSASMAIQIIQQRLEDGSMFAAMLAPKNALGRIYGRHGATIKFIIHISGAEIEIDKNNLTRNEMIEVLIKGNPKQLALAKDLIQQTVDGVNVRSVNVRKDQPTTDQRDGFRTQNNKQCQGHYQPQHIKQCQVDRRPQHNKQHEGDCRPQYNKQYEGDCKPHHNKQCQVDRRPQHNKQHEWNCRRQHNKPYEGDCRPQHNKQHEWNCRPQHNKPYEGDFRPQHIKQCQGDCRPQHIKQCQGDCRPQHIKQCQGDCRPQHNIQWHEDYRPQYNKQCQGNCWSQHNKQCHRTANKSKYCPNKLVARNTIKEESGPIPALMQIKATQPGRRNTAVEAGGSNENKAADVSRQTVLEVIVPHKAVGSVIGKQGVTIQKICADTGVKLRFKDTLHRPRDQDDGQNILVIHGSEGSVDCALELIRMIIRPFSIISKLADHEIVRKRECVVELDIPKKMIRTVTGKEWINIRQTEQKTGARMYLPECHVTGRGVFVRRMVIRGTSDATRQAEEIIRKLMVDIFTEEISISVHKLRTMFGDLNSGIQAINRFSHDNARITVSSEGDDKDSVAMKLITITGRQKDTKKLKGFLTHLVDLFEAKDRGAQAVKELDNTGICTEPAGVELIQPEAEIIEHKIELFECGCCFDDEIVFEEMGQCNAGHLFCRMCITRYCEEIMGQGRSKFPCLGADCEEHFSPFQLEIVLQSPLREGILKIVQAEELRQANIADLVICPHCPYAVIMSDERDTVLHCENVDCLKQTCRLCKEPNHLPFRCDQVEKPGETCMRTFIENKMTDALVRTCHSCGKRFYKVEGCNHMTCECGAAMCYVCRQPVSPAGDHFAHTVCQQYSDVATLHEREVREAGETAKRSYVAAHPEASGLNLIFDPLAPTTIASSVTRQPLLRTPYRTYRGYLY